MPAPERRTRGDLTAVAVLTVVVLAVTAALWWTSAARTTTLRTATGPAPQVPVESGLPAALTEIWRLPSPATPVPVVQGGTVVTGADGEVLGRDLVSGSVRWRYRRDLPLCTVAPAVGRVAALYQRGGNCSEVTTLHWADGDRGAQRNGPVEAPTRLLADGDQAATTGRHYTEVWRNDLVRTLSYGRLPTPAQPGTQPRPECTHESTALKSSGPAGARLAMIEHCPSEESARLTVQSSHPKEPDEPEVDFSTPLSVPQAQVIALGPRRVAVAVAVPGPARLLVFDERGNQVAAHPLSVPEADLRTVHPGGVAMITATPAALYWFTGSATIALDPTSLRPRWTRTGTRGLAVIVDDRLLVPTPGALTVLDEQTAAQVATLPVDRGSYRGPVTTATSGGVILEQRGDALVALR